MNKIEQKEREILDYLDKGIEYGGSIEFNHILEFLQEYRTLIEAETRDKVIEECINIYTMDDIDWKHEVVNLLQALKLKQHD